MREVVVFYDWLMGSVGVGPQRAVDRSRLWWELDFPQIRGEDTLEGKEELKVWQKILEIG